MTYAIKAMLAQFRNSLFSMPVVGSLFFPGIDWIRLESTLLSLYIVHVEVQQNAVLHITGSANSRIKCIDTVWHILYLR